MLSNIVTMLEQSSEQIWYPTGRPRFELRLTPKPLLNAFATRRHSSRLSKSRPSDGIGAGSPALIFSDP